MKDRKTSPEDSRSTIVSRIAHEAYQHAPRILPKGPWWRYLESNFSERPEGFELKFRDLWRVEATAASDVFIRTAGASLIGALALPIGYHPFKIREMFRDRDFYELMADSGDPQQFFHEPPKDHPIRRETPRWPYFRPEGGVCEDLSFESPFEPVNPHLRKSYLSIGENRIARARYWRHNEGPRPTIIAVHGFFADPYWLNEWFFALPWFYRKGCDVLLYTLPFHGRRQSKFSPFSGHGFFAYGLSHMNEAFAHAVYDFRILMNFLEREMGAKKIGVTGVSLGGYTSAILACAEPRLQFSVPNVPVVSIADLVLEWEPVGKAVRLMLFALRRSVKDIRHMLAVHCPLTYRPVLPKNRLMIIGGVGDRLAPPKHSRLLWDHWGRCRIHWYPGSHLLHLDKGDYLRQMAKFLTEIRFLEPSHR